MSFVAASCALGLLFTAAIPTAAAQEMMGEIPAMESDGFDPGAPEVEMGGGEFFSQELGTLLRMRYNTESYGQERRGNLDLGTMRVANFQDSIAFFDGQVTLSDVNGVGYNLGVGFRWLGWTPFALEPERITGFSFWADGSSTESGNFFPQVGVSYESLGDMWDLRVNGYIPIGDESQIGEFRPTGAISFDENFLVQEALADRNTSFNVGEAEVARRIMSDRDAWAFVGPYVLVNSDQDTAGYRVGMRGYAYPDLLLQLAVTEDDIFKTNATFSVTWFVGRTRNNFQPACGLADRMREPVMRNDYVALQRTTEVGGEPLTDTNGDAFRFVHVDSDAPAGGNGTFESPLNDVGTVEANSIENDIVLMWSTSVFNNQNTLELRDNQRLLGEGNGEFFTVNTQQQGVVVIPETSPGARDLARPEIVGAQGLGAVRLADTNEVANFNIDGTGSTAGAAGIFSPALGAGNPNIHDIDMRDVLGTGIQFTPLSRDNTNNAFKTIAGNVTIDDVNFNNMGDVEIDIDSESADASDSNNTLQETISITDVNSQNGSNRGIWLRNTHASRTATITNYTNGTLGTPGSGGGLGGAGDVGVLVFEGTAVNDFDGNVTLTNIDIFNNVGYALDFSNQSSTSATTITSGNGLTYDGGTGAAGGMRFNNFNGTITGNSSTITNGTLSGVRVTGTSDGTINLLNTVTFDSNDPVVGEAVINVGPGGTDSFTGALTVAGAITNHDTGRLVSIQRVTSNDATVTLNGNMTDVANGASTGILVANNTDGTILFGGVLTVDTTNTNAITLTNNTGADISFAGMLDVTADGVGAKALEATGGGTLTVSATTNELSTSGSTGVDIQGMTITNAGANFSRLDVTTGPNGIVLRDNTGGPITFGTLNDPVGDGGTISDTTGTAVVIDNSANVTISSMIIDSPGFKGIEVTKDTTTTQTVNLNDLRIGDNVAGTAGSTIAIDVIGDGGASDTLNMTVNDVDIQDATQFGIRFTNVDSGTIQVNGTTIDGDDVTGTAQGVLIADSNASITFDGSTVIQQFDGTDFEVSGGTPAVTYSGGINNTTGRSVHVHNITGGNVQFSAASTITDTALGILVENNTGGSISFLGTNDLDPAAAATEAVRLNTNTGATMTFAGLNINTAAGSTTQGLVATGGGTLSTTGTNNIINTKDGTGLLLNGMTIGSVDLQSVTVNGTTGPVNAVLLQNLTGGQVEIGTTGGAQNSGGVLESTGDAIVIENAQNVALRDMQITSSARGVVVTHDAAGTTNMDVTVDGLNLDASTGNGVEITASSTTNTFVARLINSELEENVVFNATGSQLIQMRTTNTDIDVSGTTDAFAANISGNATNVDMILSDTDFVAADASAVTITTSGGTGKTFDLLVENGSFTNTSATNPAAEFTAGGNVTYNATIRGNTFDDGDGAGSDFTMTSTGAQARMRLNLGGDDAAEMNSALGNGEFNLIEVPGSDFDVFAKTDTFADLRNNGTVFPQSPVTVLNPAAFDDLLVAPTVPVIP